MLPQILLFAVVVTAIVFSVCFQFHITIKKVKISVYWLVATAGAVLAVAVGFVPLSALKEAFLSNTAVNPLKILILFFSMTAISIFLDEAGFYAHLASIMVKKAGTSRKKLFFLLFALVSVLTVFTSNDVIILTFTPFILYFSKRSGIDPVPYIFAEFVAANTWSMFFVFGNPTNIYIAQAFGIDFLSYAKVMAPVTLLSGMVALFALYAVFHKSLSAPLSPVTDAEGERFDRGLSAIGLTFLSLCVVALAIASYVHLEMWMISLFFALACFAAAFVCLAVERRGFRLLGETVKTLPWALAPFLISMFVLILSLDTAGVTTVLAEKLPQNAFVYGAVSFLSANVLNNIPMGVLFTSVLSSVGDMGAVYAVIVGSNLGALLTPVGALAGIMWMNIVKVHNVDFSFGKFLKYGCMISVPALAAALGCLFLTV